MCPLEYFFLALNTTFFSIFTFYCKNKSTFWFCNTKEVSLGARKGPKHTALFHYSWPLCGCVNILLHLLSLLLWPLTFAVLTNDFLWFLAIKENLHLFLCFTCCKLLWMRASMKCPHIIQCKYWRIWIAAVSGRVMNLSELRLLISIFYSGKTYIIRGQATLQLGVCASCSCHAVSPSVVEDNKDSLSGQRGQHFRERARGWQRGKGKRVNGIKESEEREISDLRCGKSKGHVPGES